MSTTIVRTDTSAVVEQGQPVPAKRQPSTRRSRRFRVASNMLLLIVISAFAFVMIGAFLALAATIFLPPRDTGNAQMVLAIFSSSVSFLAGLFANNPLEERARASQDDQSDS